VVKGLKKRAARCNRVRRCDGWVQLADPSTRLPYFYDFATGKRQREFPAFEPGEIPPCCLPPRTLEPSAARLAAAAETAWAGLRGDMLERAAKKELWEPRRVAHGEALTHCPLPIEVLVQQGLCVGGHSPEPEP
jgi:hypothetical protein